MRALVVGGAGYIGSHMVKLLAMCGYQVVTLDNLSTGHRDAVRYGEFVQGDISDAATVDLVLARHRPDVVLHFAACSIVAESVRDPGKYYRNNVASTLNLLDAMVRHGVPNLIFSSTAAVYGEPVSERIAETHPQGAINPYGRSKLMVEQILDDYASAFGLKYTALRYFNAAGADPDGELGERHQPETHLIPLVLQVAAGRRENITIYGTDYPTPDGTCIRDYIHVTDLCHAHHLAFQRLADGGRSGIFNLGNGGGFSVKDVVDKARDITGRPIPIIEGTARQGDPARLVADATRARSELGWVPKHPDLETIIGTAWAWERHAGAEAAGR